MGQNTQEFVLTISDNGRGMGDRDKSGPLSLGLLGMQERAHLVGGKIEITGAIPKGTQITLRIAL
jgi:signal transduction histidine kinase